MTPSRFLGPLTRLRLLSPANKRPTTLSRTFLSSPQFSSASSARAASESLPRVLQPSLWQTMVPKRWRKVQDTPNTTGSSSKSKEWNPATPFIALGVLIGSQAIHTLVLRNEMVQFSQKAEAKIALLKEVIERIQKGEDVEVEKILGTGDPTQEREWAEVIKEIEAVDSNRRQKRTETSIEAESRSDIKSVATNPEPSVDHDIGRRRSIPKGFY